VAAETMAHHSEWGSACERCMVANAAVGLHTARITAPEPQFSSSKHGTLLVIPSL